MQTLVVHREGEAEGESAGPRMRGLGWLSPNALRLGCLLVLFSLALPGCSGCRQDSEEEAAEQEEEEEEEPKEDFESGRLTFVPSADKERAGQPRGSLKPGHWGVLSQEMRANNDDFNGQLYVAPANRSQQEMEIERTPYRLALQRPVSLPQGQTRPLRLMYFMPRPRENDASSAYLRIELRTKGGGRTVSQVPSASGVAMPDHQYFVVVLAGRADDYGYLAANLSRAPVPGNVGRNNSLYKVLLPTIVKQAPLPEHPLAWTSIAYLVLDDFDPTTMTTAQQMAMIDWLHWGGQIIVSGPRTLDRLKGTPLAEYLPVEGGAAVELQAADYQEINAYWHLDPKEDSSTRNDGRNPPVDDSQAPGDAADEGEDADEAEVEGAVEAAPRRDSTGTLLVSDGVELTLREDGYWLPHTGELVAERSVGRGRIVVTSFSLANRGIANYWISRESFINGALLGLPGRGFTENDNFESSFEWLGQESGFPLDPRVVCKLRFFSRDLGEEGGSVVMRPHNEILVEEAPVENLNYYQVYQEPQPVREPETWTDFVEDANLGTVRQQEYRPAEAALSHEGWATAPQSGVGGWYDFSATANAARETLNEAAGIEVPSGVFVAQVLLGYIVVLVPLNWLFFRLIGRVELAWVAAPIIAIVGMVVVVKVAQLDIGFARSRTEVAVLELQPGHERGHLTRYVGLYTSLATGFSLGAEEPAQPGDMPLLLPFSTDPKPDQLQQTRSTVRLDRDDGVELNGMNMISASTGMVHIEQMLPLGGTLRLVEDELAGEQIMNGTTLTLHDVGIVRRTPRGLSEAAWVGELEAGAIVPLEFRPLGEGEIFPEWGETSTTRPSRRDGEISLRRLMDLASDPHRLRGGDARLVGWYDAELAPIEVSPRTTQNVFRTMVVANLAYGGHRVPNRDVNLPPAQSEDSEWEAEPIEFLPTE